MNNEDIHKTQGSKYENLNMREYSKNYIDLAHVAAVFLENTVVEE